MELENSPEHGQMTIKPRLYSNNQKVRLSGQYAKLHGGQARLKQKHAKFGTHLTCGATRFRVFNCFQKFKRAIGRSFRQRPSAVNKTPHLAASYSQPVARYATLARALLADIQAGRYQVGAQLPTELELCERFGVSRYTVRQALRELKDIGVISTRQGIGTLVRAQPTVPNLIYSANTVEDLLQITKQTRIQLLSVKDVIADEALAEFLPCRVGQQWIILSQLRFLPTFTIPVAYLTTYIRSEFANIIPRIGVEDLPIFRMIEQEHGQRLGEIQQEIVSIALGAEEAKAVGAEPGFHALQMTRRFFDERDRLTQVTIASYPGGRFTHTSTFRLKRGGDDEKHHDPSSIS